MSDLKSIDRLKLEKFFGMGGGYVCDFYNKSLQDFVLEITGIDIYVIEYEENGNSKANRLRTFWKKESNYVVSKLIREMSEYWKSQKYSTTEGITPAELALHEECIKISDRLIESTPIENIDDLTPNSDDKNFTQLSIMIKEALMKDEPQNVLDRLHTFTVKYLRELCNNHSIPFTKETPLHSLMGTYIKYLTAQGYIESGVTEKILKSSISILEEFNHVRNNQSLAHDNTVLNYTESVLITNNIIASVKFIRTIEERIANENAKKEKAVADTFNASELPF